MRVLYGGIRRHIGRTYRGNFRRGRRGFGPAATLGTTICQLKLASSNSIRTPQCVRGDSTRGAERVELGAPGAGGRVAIALPLVNSIPHRTEILSSLEPPRQLVEIGRRRGYRSSESADPCRVGKGGVGDRPLNCLGQPPQSHPDGRPF
jgi:hypothetical protein